MRTFEVSAADARDIYMMACENIGKLEKALAKFPAGSTDPTYLYNTRNLERFKALRDRADAAQQADAAE